MKNTLLIGLLTLIVATPISAQQVFRWVDSNGQVHFSSEKPNDTSADTVQIPKTGATQQPITKENDTDNKDKAVDNQQQQYNVEMQKKAVTDEAQLKTACTNMRKDLALYQNYPRARVKVGDDTRRLTPEELNQRITELQKNINENCQDQ